MNLSGNSLAAAARFFKLPTEQIAVVHDDVDLEPGRIQVRLGGGLAGHNGLRSIREALGSAEFLRVRAGVGRPGRGDRRPGRGLRVEPVRARGRRRSADLPFRRRGRDAGRRRPRRGAAPLQLGGFGGIALAAGVRCSFEARTKGAPIAEAIGATEDAESGRAARPSDSAAISPNPPRRLGGADGDHAGGPGALRRLHLHRVADLRADERGAERRVGGEPPATLEISTSKRPPLSSSTSTTEPTPTTPSSACSTMTAFSTRCRRIAIRRSSRPCSFFASW